MTEDSTQRMRTYARDLIKRTFDLRLSAFADLWCKGKGSPVYGEFCRRGQEISSLYENFPEIRDIIDEEMSRYPPPNELETWLVKGMR